MEPVVVNIGTNGPYGDCIIGAAVVIPIGPDICGCTCGCAPPAGAITMGVVPVIRTGPCGVWCIC